MAHLKTPRGYAEDFDSTWFMENKIQQLKNKGILTFQLDFLHDVFKTGQYKGNMLLDVGSGPTSISVISASRHVTEIHLSDVSPRNRDTLYKWRDGESNVVELFQYVMNRENDSEALEERVSMMRKKVTKIYDVDMRLPDPLPSSSCKYDVVIASLLLCAVAKTKQEFIEVLRKTIAMIKPGGYLIVIGVLNIRHYQVGEFLFTNVDIKREDMKGIFLNENLRIDVWRESDPSGYSPNYDNPKHLQEEGIFGMVAQKVEEH